MTRLQSAVRQAAEWSEFTYKDDHDYDAFCRAIRAEVEREGIQRFVKDGVELDSVRTNKLYGVWYTSATFRAHWKEPMRRANALPEEIEDLSRHDSSPSHFGRVTTSPAGSLP